MSKTHETPEAVLARLERKSENLFRAWRTAYYRRVVGELKTDRAVDTAREHREIQVNSKSFEVQGLHVWTLKPGK